MQNEQVTFLNLNRIPARLEAREAAWYLGFAPDEISILVTANLLNPLEPFAANGARFFATAALDKLHNDCGWLARASDALVQHRQSQTVDTTKPDNSNGHKVQAESRPAKPATESKEIGTTGRMAYSLREAAAMLGVDYFSVYRLIQRGKLKACRALRGKFLVPRSELLKLMKTQ
jgi:excisionase family DNA binding protein